MNHASMCLQRCVVTVLVCGLGVFLAGDIVAGEHALGSEVDRLMGTLVEDDLISGTVLIAVEFLAKHHWAIGAVRKGAGLRVIAGCAEDNRLG